MIKTLYKIDSKGKVREWTIVVEGDKYRFITGLVDGKKVESDWTVAVPMNVGRSNETSPEQQALLEAQSHIQSKRDEFYHDTIELAKNTPKDFTPMLADRYEWNGPCYSQPKLDGIRCLAAARGLYSRGNEPIVSVPHIWDAVKPVLDAHPGLVLDGELYNHDFKEDFNSLSSMIRKTKTLTPEVMAKSKQFIEYHIYDCHYYDDMAFSERTSFLQSLKNQFGQRVVLVDTDLVAHEDQLDILYTNYLLQGYEGQMTRVPSSLYEQKRSKGLLKRKPLYEGGGNDTEFEILGIEEGRGNWAGKAKVVRCLLPNGEDFGATLKGNMKRAKEIWDDRQNLIGKLATVQFQGYTPDGVPRFPNCIDLDRGKW